MSNFKFERNWVATSNQLAQDKRLSWKARGIFLYLASMSDGWNFYVDEVANHAPQGKQALQAGLKELEEYGYLERVNKHSDNGDFGGTKWILTAEPVSRQTQNRVDAKTRQTQNRVDAKTRQTPNRPLINTNNNKQQIAINTNCNKRNTKESSDDLSGGTSSAPAPYSEIIDYLNEKTGKSYKATSRNNQELIKARWNEGYTVDDFKKVIDNKVSDWKDDSKMNKYLQPSTLFRASKFEGYLNEKPKQKASQGSWDDYYKANNWEDVW